MIQLKDVIKYYIGCDVIIDGKERGRLMGANPIPNSVGQVYWQIITEEMKLEDEDFCMPYNDDLDMGELRIKPILRPLASMTREEMKDIWRIVHGRIFPESGKIVYLDAESRYACKRWCMMSGVDRVGIEFNGTIWADCDLHTHKFNPQIVSHYLLSKHFDLFDLIPSKQAIEAKPVANGTSTTGGK
jgi:hypothetical protein